MMEEHIRKVRDISEGRTVEYRGSELNRFNSLLERLDDSLKGQNNVQPTYQQPVYAAPPVYQAPITPVYQAPVQPIVVQQPQPVYQAPPVQPEPVPRYEREPAPRYDREPAPRYEREPASRYEREAESREYEKPRNREVVKEVVQVPMMDDDTIRKLGRMLSDEMGHSIINSINDSTRKELLSVYYHIQANIADESKKQTESTGEQIKNYTQSVDSAMANIGTDITQQIRLQTEGEQMKMLDEVRSNRRLVMYSLLLSGIAAVCAGLCLLLSFV